MVYVPKIEYYASSAKRIEADRAYAFLFDVQKNTEVDLKQLLLNVIVAAIMGGVIGAAPLWLIRRVTIGALAIIVIRIAAAVVTEVVTARKEAPERARADEAYAVKLYKSGQTEAAKEKLIRAAENWRIAERPEDERRVRAEAENPARFGKYRDLFDEFLDAPVTTPTVQGDEAKRAEPVRSASAFLDAVDASPSPAGRTQAPQQKTWSEGDITLSPSPSPSQKGSAQPRIRH